MFFLVMLTINLSQNAQDARTVVYIVALGTIATSFVYLCRAIFRAFEKMEWDIVPTVAGTCFLLGVGFFVLYSGYDLVQVVWVYSAAQLLIFAVGLAIVITKFTRPRIKLAESLWKYLLVTTVPFALNGLLVQVYFRIDTVILAFLKGDIVVGWYTAAYTLAVIPLSVIITGFGRALFPSVAHAFVFTKELYRTLVERAVRYSLVLLIPMATGVTLLAGKIIPFIFGSQFSNSIGSLQLLIWAGILLFLNILYVGILEATRKQKRATLLLAIGAGMNTVLSFVLIPQFSLTGAAISALVTQLICVLISCYMVGQNIEIKALANSFIKPIIASAVMGLFIFYFGYLHIILLIFIGIVIYCLSFYLLRGITEEDLKTFKSLIDINREKQE